ncbi:sodium-dependent bicarbonate transport family permease [Alkalihalobacterium chitinilyticum]|uniref:Sodium-dependent bicarbonate transport family permease n=1 Tax=Alkalihalobacterium chitinilyticum TaxID=2980103 RepID=A0ABT5VFB9_9BACI|nr:sodium-dependent bicarbonate transport family permease [Alkalihalobacterium chitinilyticum]MDE5413397.1 sodium-dependent bicarbonate transport family permease [Alkalihalobacterium chitinilyticum]
MELIYEIAYTNLLSPMILFFLIGIVAVIVNSDLKVPGAFYTGYTMIILLTIGIKGGVELRNVTLMDMLPTIITSIVLSIIMFGIAFITVKGLFKFSLTDSFAISAHYGSVSAVTFIAGIAFLEKVGVYYEAYMSAILVIMEGPAIILAIVLYKVFTQKQNGADENPDASLKHVIKEAFFGKSIFLLLGGIFIGYVAHTDGLVQIRPLFGDLFYGILCIFLLHMGMVATQSIRQLKNVKPTSFLFAFILPVVGGTLGVLAGYFIGLSLGGAVVLAFLTGSASYIAAPAAVGQAIPEANSGVYIGSALGLTLPFNLIVGIPYFYWLASVVYPV